MNNKKIQNIAQEILKLEKIIASPDSTVEEKENAEKKISNYAYSIFRLKDGFSIMEKIDEFVQKNI